MAIRAAGATPVLIAQETKREDAKTYISAEQSKARQNARISRAYEECRWARGFVAPPGPRPPQAHGERRESCPVREGELAPPRPVRLLFREHAESCVQPNSEWFMTKAFASPIPCSRPSAWRERVRRAERASDSPFRVRSAERWCAIASNAGSARSSGTVAPRSDRNGISSLTHAGPPSTRHLPRSSARSER